MSSFWVRRHVWLRCSVPAGFLVTSLLAAAPAAAQNLVTNSNLAASLGPWTEQTSTAPDPVGTGSVSWTAAFNDDATVDGTGSASIQLAGATAQPANASIGIRQCVALPSPPADVSSASYGAHFLAPATGNPSDGLAEATVEVRFYSDAGCTAYIPGAGGSQGYSLSTTALSDSGWHEIGDSDLAMPGPPVVAASAEVRAFVRTLATTDNGYRVYFDRIWMSINQTVPVELSNLDVE